MPIGATHRSETRSDDEDDFFKPTPSSSLAKIFGISKGSGGAAAKGTKPSPEQSTTKSVGKVSDRYGASSFRYVPPQEVAESVVSDDEGAQKKPSSPEWSLVQASVVTAYRLIDNENVAQGKLGLALLRSGPEYRILIYRTKTDALATLNISGGTKMFLKNNYLQFQSDDKAFWSVLFENSSDCDRLIDQIQTICTVEQEKPQPAPIPAARTIPIVEEPESDLDNSSSSASKAKLISRMARMGQSILPHQDSKPTTQSTTTEVSDSSDTEAVRLEMPPRPAIPAHHRRTSSGSSGGAGAGNKMHPMAAMGMQMVPAAANALTTAIAGQNMLHTATDVNFNLFMTESRMQGTEVRMNLSKLESKLDRMLDKIDLLDLNKTGGAKEAVDRDEDILALEEKVLELKKENHVLKGKLRSVEAEGNSRREDMMAKQQLLDSEKLCQQLKDKIEQLERDLQTSNQERKNAIEKLEQLTKDVEAKNTILEDKTKETNTLTEQLKVAQTEQTALAETNLSLTKQVEKLAESLKTIEQELETQKSKNNSTADSLDDLVKRIMNNCFQQMCEKIDDPSTLRTIGQIIKQETKAALAQKRSV